MPVRDADGERRTSLAGGRSRRLGRASGGWYAGVIGERTVKDFSLVLAGVGVNRFLVFVTFLIAARLLSVAEFGALSLAYTLTTLVGNLPNELDNSFVRNYIAAPSSGERAGFVRAHLSLKIGLSVVLIALGCALSPFIAGDLFNKPEIGPMICLGIVAGALWGLLWTQLAYCQARRHFWAWAVFSATQAAVVLAVVGAYFSASVPTALGTMTAVSTAYAGVAVAVVLLLVHGSTPSREAVRRARRTLVRFGGWLLGAGVVYLVLQRIDILFLAHSASFYTLGLYGAALRLTTIVTLFTGQLTVVFLPMASRAIGSPATLRRFLARSGAAAAAVTAVAALGILLAPAILRISVGTAYVGATPPLRLLLLGYIFVAIAEPLSCLIYAHAEMSRILVYRSIELAVAVIAVITLVPRFSADGAALSLCFAYASGMLYVLFTTRKYLKLARLREAPILTMSD